VGTKNPKIDTYIGKSAEFAHTILTHLRKLVHAACPEVAEDLKWGHPFFIYKGPLCMMPAFKQHCSFGFWNSKVVQAKIAELAGADGKWLGTLGRITSISNLPADKVLICYIRLAVGLKDTGIKARPKPATKAKLVVPKCLAAELKKNAKAQATFEQFSHSHKKEYVEWINDAKTDQTRNRRLKQAAEWMAEAKPRHWKYQKC
jgi:uncharacterized protein YdeI (YjbR/CyaY-like superfamily)